MKIELLIGLHSYKSGLSKISLSQIYLQSQNLFIQPADIYVDC